MARAMSAQPREEEREPKRSKAQRSTCTVRGSCLLACRLPLRTSTSPRTLASSGIMRNFLDAHCRGLSIAPPCVWDAPKSSLETRLLQPVQSYGALCIGRLCGLQVTCKSCLSTLWRCTGLTACAEWVAQLLQNHSPVSLRRFRINYEKASLGTPRYCVCKLLC